MVFHHLATEGLGDVETEREVMKSEMMDFWVGLKFPYHIRLTEMLPERRGPLWYFIKSEESGSNSVSFLVAKEAWRMEKKTKRRCRRKVVVVVAIFMKDLIVWNELI